MSVAASSGRKGRGGWPSAGSTGGGPGRSSGRCGASSERQHFDPAFPQLLLEVEDEAGQLAIGGLGCLLRHLDEFLVGREAVGSDVLLGEDFGVVFVGEVAATALSVGVHLVPAEGVAGSADEVATLHPARPFRPAGETGEVVAEADEEGEHIVGLFDELLSARLRVLPAPPLSVPRMEDRLSQCFEALLGSVAFGGAAAGEGGAATRRRSGASRCLPSS